MSPVDTSSGQAASGEMAAQLQTYVLRLADDNMILAQRLGALVSWMPELEEDIAVANLGLDHLGAARNLYAYATTLDPSTLDPTSSSRSEDELAMLRSEREFLNAVMVEQPNGDFAQTLVRQFLVDAFQVPLYQALAESRDDQLAAIGSKAVKEARYHLDYSSNWVVTLGDGTGESHARAQAALDALWRYTDDLFQASAGLEALVEAGIAVDPASIRPAFEATVAEVMAAAHLTIPDDGYQRTGGRTGFHTEHLGHLLTEMQWLFRSDPGATW